MYQHAEEPQEHERRPLAPHEQTSSDREQTPASGHNEADRDRRPPEGSFEERQPTIEPASPPTNITKIEDRREPAREAADSSPGSSMADPSHAPRGSLFPASEIDIFRTDWQRVQATFVDDPPNAIQQADELVSRTIVRLSDVFAEERRRLEPKSDGEGAASTEDLRQGLQRYRAFFDRLLSL